MPEDGGIGGGILAPRLWLSIVNQKVAGSPYVPPPLPHGDWQPDK